jgi:hypothetical protein
MTEFAAPKPVTLSGVEYRFAPLNLADIEELDNWIRKEYMKRVQSCIPDGTSPKDREEALGIGLKTAVNLTWLSGQGAQLIASVRGMAKIAQLGLIKNHPEMTYEKLLDILKADRQALEELSEAMRSPKQAFRQRQAKGTKVSKASQKR